MNTRLRRKRWATRQISKRSSDELLLQTLSQLYQREKDPAGEVLTLHSNLSDCFYSQHNLTSAWQKLFYISQRTNKSRTQMRSSTMPSSATMATASIFLIVQSTIMLASAQKTNEQQPILCVDNHRYISRFGLNCEMHRKLHCDSFAHIGFSPMEVLELYTACPIACQREECLAEYSAIYDDAANGSTFSCEDDQDYTSPFGMKCIDHASIDCEQLIALGMQPHQMEELLDACPRSCDVPRPECSLYPPIGQAGSNQATSASNVGGNAVLESNNNDLAGGACFEGWDETCQDNSEYTSPMGLGCAESFGKIDCLKLSRVGFTEIQMLEAIQSCPCSCQIECGYSMPPSSSPTSSPSDIPSMEPSVSPTMPPTARPSASPSDVPSFSPTAR